MVRNRKIFQISAMSFFAGIFANLSQAAALRLFIGTFYGTEILFGLFLALWLAGVSLGGLWGAIRPLSFLANFWFFAISPILALLGLYGGIPLLPPCNGGFLPILPVASLMGLFILPMSLPIGLLIPSLITGKDFPLFPIYSFEALGGFLGGVLFSFLLGGAVHPVSLMLPIPILVFSGMILIPRKRFLPALMALIWPWVTIAFAPYIENVLESRIWSHFHPGITCSLFQETPYQKIQVGDYEGQKSLYIDGTFSAAWPDPIRAEERVHFFMTSLAAFSKILIIGAPTPDLLEEFKKYIGLKVTIVELDKKLLTLFSAMAATESSIRWIESDPRLFLRIGTDTYDGILVLPSDPTTLLSNRLFTKEAFTDMAKRLSPTGVLSISVTGTENYLGADMERVLLSTHRTLSKVFLDIFAVPGDPVIFWASQNPDVLVMDCAILENRFRERNIPTASFQPLSFRNILLPFRVMELKNWLSREVPVPLNEDAFPRAFRQQLRLWDVFSGSKIGSFLDVIEKWTGPKLFTSLFTCFLIVLLLFSFFPSKWKIVGTALTTASISGSLGLLTEIILMFLYQNRNGAMFQMAALFFGIYMLGLSVGSLVSRLFSWEIQQTLIRIKAFQIFLSMAIFLAVPISNWHTTAHIGCAIFLTAFLGGWEFPLLDVWQRSLGILAETSAGVLMWTDNLGAVLIALLAGIWFLPILGINASLAFVVLVFSMNFVLLWVAREKKF